MEDVVRQNHFKAECKCVEPAARAGQNTRHKVVHDVEQYTEGNMQVDAMNITSFNFKSILSIIVTKLDTGSSQNNAKIPYKVDIDSDDNFMPQAYPEFYTIGY